MTNLKIISFEKNRRLILMRKRSPSHDSSQTCLDHSRVNLFFLTGEAGSINALTKAVGFQYQYDEKTNQYAHATAIMVLTPQGRISRYFYGVDFPPKDLRMGLVEASQGKIGNAVDAVLLYCYHYNPETGKYGAMVANILRLAAGATILLLGGLLFILWRLDRSVPRRTLHGGARTH